MTYELPPLRFGWNDLEPYFTADMLKAHVATHQGFTDAVNTILRSHPELDGQTIERVMAGIPNLPEPLRTQVRAVAGGHGNHQFLWKIIGPPSAKTTPSGALAATIEETFGSFAGFVALFRDKALAFGGQGWAFLVLEAWDGEKLEVLTLPENDSVLPLRKPGVLICDLWDHARAPKYPDRASYLDAFFKVVDWSVCEARYQGFRDGSMRI